jgi:hypothetical protein
MLNDYSQDMVRIAKQMIESGVRTLKVADMRRGDEFMFYREIQWLTGNQHIVDGLGFELGTICFVGLKSEIGFWMNRISDVRWIEDWKKNPLREKVKDKLVVIIGASHMQSKYKYVLKGIRDMEPYFILELN